MLRINVIHSASQAKSYFGAQLSKGDYYAHDQAQEIAGRWGGTAAERIGLHGEVDRQSFFDLADHTNPVTGDPLTLRRNTNRRVGYDFTFSASKSVSAYYAYTGDERIVRAFDAAVQETMSKDIEPNIKVRVRQQGETQANRTTGNGLWSSFTHHTSRPVDGVPDPQLHNHVILHNVTWDKEYRNRDGSRGAWMAAEIGDIKGAGQYYQAAFHARLARKLTEMGLSVRQSEHGFELNGFTPEMKTAFSRRTAQIERRAEELGITYAEDKAALGAKTREKKQDNLSMAELRREWRNRLSDREWQSFLSQAQSGGSPAAVTDREALDYSLDHLLERQSVARQSDVLAHALHRGIGTVTPESLQAEFAGRGDLISAEQQEQTLVTTENVLAEEAAMIGFARDGRGAAQPLGDAAFRLRPIRRGGQVFELNPQQKQAVAHLLDSRSRVILVRGAAGTGKTSMLAEAIRGIEENGKWVHAFAPTAAARDVLQQDGQEGGIGALKNAHTVAKLLQDRELQSGVKNGVLLIDEAGLLSSRDMKRVFDLAQEQNARVILSGDYKQHSSVPRGDAMRILVEQAGLRPAVLEDVRRQRHAVYKSAVEAFSRGTKADVIAGFDQLDGMGMIREVTDVERRNAILAEGYVESVRSGKSALVVSPTHAEGEQVTDSIRGRLKAAGLIGATDRAFTRLRNLHLTEAQKANPESYAAGQVVQFHRPSRVVPSSTFEIETVIGMGLHGPRLQRQFEKHSRKTQVGYNWKGETGLQQNAPVPKGLTYGTRGTVLGRDERGNVHLRTDAGEVVQLPLAEPEKFSVYEQTEVQLARGDMIRITQNMQSKPRHKNADPHRLSNGSLYRVAGFTRNGDLRLENGWVIDTEAGFVAPGYVTTSHASQGKTRDVVFVAQSSESFPASNMAQWYVSTSRAREAVVVVTDDKHALRNQAILRSGERMAATELAAKTADRQVRQAEAERAERQRSYLQRLNEIARRARDAASRKVRQVRDYYQQLRQQYHDRGPAHEH